MRKILEPYTELFYALMRVVFAFIFWCHGFQKLFGAFGLPRFPLFSLLGAAAVIEFLCGFLIAFGLFTSPVAFLCSGEMAIAYFLGHYLGNGRGLPIQNGGEPAVLLCFGFLFIAAHGGGKWSLDAMMRHAPARSGPVSTATR